jgi:hypothetical protein
MKNGQQKVMEGDKRVAAYERHARIYCAKMGENPDQPLPLPHPQLAGVVVQVPVWYTVAERMFDLTTLLRSISEGNQPAANDAPKVEVAGA